MNALVAIFERNDMDTEMLLDLIKHERKRQDEKWGLGKETLPVKEFNYNGKNIIANDNGSPIWLYI